MKYAYTGMVINQFDGQQLANCDPASGKCDDEYVYRVLGMENRLSIGLNIIFLAVIYVVLIVAAFLVLWFRFRNVGQSRKNQKGDE